MMSWKVPMPFLSVSRSEQSKRRSAAQSRLIVSSDSSTIFPASCCCCARADREAGKHTTMAMAARKRQGAGQFDIVLKNQCVSERQRQDCAVLGCAAKCDS